MATYFWFLASGNRRWDQTGAQSAWYTATNGGGTKITASAPTSADVVVFDANSGAGTCSFAANYTANCLDLLCNGYGAVGPTATTLTSSAGVTINVYRDIALSNNAVFDVKQYPTVVMTDSTNNGTISTNGNSFGGLTIDKGTASITLNDDLIGTGNAVLALTSGTLNANNKNVTFGSFITSGTAARTLTMGSGTWNMCYEGEISSLAFNSWDINSTTNLTFNKGTATIVLNHSRNNPATNDSLVAGLKNALTSSASTIDLVDITGFTAATAGSVLIGNEVISYTGVTGNQLTGLTRGVGGTTTLSSVPAGTAVIGVLYGNSTLAAPLVSGVSTTADVVDSKLYPPSGDIYVGTETIHYTANNTTTNTLTLSTTPTQNHSISDPVYSYQAKKFVGGGLTYNNVVFGCFGYKLKNYIDGSNTFTNIKNTNTGFTWTATSNVYPGFQELAFAAGATNIISTSLSFTGTSAYQQQIDSQTPGTQTTLSIIPATSYWFVGTHSVDAGNNTNLQYVGGSTDYITWQDIIGLPVYTPPPPSSYLPENMIGIGLNSHLHI